MDAADESQERERRPGELSKYDVWALKRAETVFFEYVKGDGKLILAVSDGKPLSSNMRRTFGDIDANGNRIRTLGIPVRVKGYNGKGHVEWTSEDTPTVRGFCALHNVQTYNPWIALCKLMNDKVTLLATFKADRGGNEYTRAAGLYVDHLQVTTIRGNPGTNKLSTLNLLMAVSVTPDMVRMVQRFG